jgi:histidyl-tRNA synthetase
MAKTAPIPGTSDLFSDALAEWQFVEHVAARTFARYGYGELRTPMLERTDVFARSIGDDTDVVQKEMYTFEDRGGRSLTLRPEGTAGVIRAIANDGIPQGEERRVYYVGPMFRGERPAAGRRRQFHQIGVECVGNVLPGDDVEALAMLVNFLGEIGLSDCRLLLNSRGDFADREPVAAGLRAYFSGPIATMCEDCQRRLDTNVLRILDCKSEGCREVIDGAPSMLDMLSDASREHFAAVCRGLDLLEIPYEVEPRLVRGLDYYVHTVWEVAHSGIGAQDALAGGGRYAIPNGNSTMTGVGFAAGIERLLLARESLGLATDQTAGVDAYLIGLGSDAADANLRLAAELRASGHAVLMDHAGRSMRAQMRSANKAAARVALIRGDDELARGVVVCKDMATGEQTEQPADQVRL